MHDFLFPPVTFGKQCLPSGEGTWVGLMWLKCDSLYKRFSLKQNNILICGLLIITVLVELLCSAFPFGIHCNVFSGRVQKLNLKKAYHSDAGQGYSFPEVN